MKLFYDNVSLDQVDLVAQNLVEVLKASDIVIFKGDIGAGKTTLIKSIVKNLGSKDEVTSPTFAIVNIYDAKNIEKVIHIDTYRLLSVNELYDLGLETLFDEKYLTLIEWGERIQDYIDTNHFIIEIIEVDDDLRKIIIEANNPGNGIEEKLLELGWQNV